MGGTPLATGTSYTTPPISTPTNFYLQSNTCDQSTSRTIVSLTLHPSFLSVDTVAICGDSVYVWQGNPYDSSGLYNVIYSDMHGCDSTYSLHLMIEPEFSQEMDTAICQGESIVWQGSSYISAGTYATTYTGNLGCDSTYILNLTVDSVDVSVLSADPVITANNATGSYQWIDCLNGFQPISGAVSQSYTAVSNGAYAVVIDDAGCKDTSACVSVITVGLPRASRDSLLIYPNPFDDAIYVECFLVDEYYYEIYNQIGEKVLEGESDCQFGIQTSGLASGVYCLRLLVGKYQFDKFLLKK